MQSSSRRYFFLLLLFSCSNPVSKNNYLIRQQEIFLQHQLYYGPVKSTTQTFSSENKADIVLGLEWSADSRQVKTTIKGYEAVYSINFLDPAMHVDSVVMYNTISPHGTTVYHNLNYHKDYWHYGGTDRGMY